MSKGKDRALGTGPSGTADGLGWQERLGYSSSSNHEDLLALKLKADRGEVAIAPDPGGPAPLVGWHHIDEPWFGSSRRRGHVARERSSATRTPDVGEAVAPDQTAAGGTSGLLVIPIPTPLGELTEVVRAYRHCLGDEGGQRIQWRAIDDPRLCDDIYCQQRTPQMVEKDQRITASFLRWLAERGMHQLDFGDEYLLLTKLLGIPQRALPALVFAAPSPVYAIAMLPLRIELFDSDSGRRALGTFLLEEFAQKKLLRFASSDQFTHESMVALQDHLTALEKKVDRLVTRPRSRFSRLFSKHDKSPGQAPTPYAYVRGSGRKRAALTQDEYRSLLKHFGRYDFVIDGIGLRCHKRPRKGDRHESKSLTPMEFEHLQACIACKGFYMPTRRANPHGEDPAMTAIRMFNSARNKADIAREPGKFTLFHTQRGRQADLRSFEFMPPKGVTWLLIERPDE